MLKKNKKFFFKKIDLSKIDQLKKIQNINFDYIFHLAAQAGVRYSLENPHAYVNSNIVGFLNVLEACKNNDLRKLGMVDRIHKVVGDIKNKNIAILGLAFKPETDDMRKSPSIDIINGLAKLKANIYVYDPAAMSEAKQIFSKKIQFSSNAQECLKEKDILVILTEWNEFRALNPKSILELMKGNTIIDLRNIFDPKEMSVACVNYFSLGRQ